MLAIDAFLNSIEQLPPAPRNLATLLDLLHRPEVDLEQVVQLIQYDASLTAQIMRLCNSAYFGAALPASDLQEATSRLGFNEIIQLVTALSTAKLVYPQQKGYGIEAGELWKHCIVAALVGKFMAVAHDANGALTFTACILHDLGKVVLSQSLENKYAEIVEEMKRSQMPLVLLEQQVLGFDHAQVGGRLLERWKFPTELVEAVTFHHDPAKAPQHSRLAAYTYLGNTIACFMGYGCGHQAMALTGRAEALALTDTTAEDIPRIMTEAFYALRDTEALLNQSF